MSVPRKKILKFNCFSSITLDTDKEKKKHETIHETIKNDKQFMIDCFSKLPYYYELMPKIKKTSKGNNFYKGLIQKGVKNKSAFFQAIMNSIKKINEEKKIVRFSKVKKKRIKLYTLPKIEELKLKKIQIDKSKIKKIKIIQPGISKNSNEKSKSVPTQNPTTTINSSPSPIKKLQLKRSCTMNVFNINFIQGENNNNNTLNSLNNNNVNSGNSTGKHSQNNLILSPNNNDIISTNYNSNLSNSNYKSLYKNEFDPHKYKVLKRAKSLNNINLFLNHCQEEIISGKKMEGKVNIFTKKLSQEIKDKLNNNKFTKSKDYKVIEDKQKKNKYMKLEEYNYTNIKRKMNKKISNSFAYRNRKEILELLKVNENAKAIILHLNEMNKINEKMSKRRIIERKRIDKINSLCEVGFRKKEILKKKIDIFNIKHKELNELDQSRDNVLNDISNINVSKSDNLLRGTLLPKLLTLRKQYYQNESNEVNSLDYIIK